MSLRTLLAVLAFVLSAGAAEPPEAKMRTDRNGDPLPDGAVARFGSARLLHGRVDHLEFSPDGKTLASSGSDGVRLWDLADGKVVPCAHLPQWGRTVFCFTPDGGHLVGDADGCRLIDPRTGKVRRSWQHGTRAPQSIVVAADGKTAAVGWIGGGVTVHDLTRGGKQADWKITDDVPDELCLSGDGALLAYALKAGKKSVLLWDARRGKLLHTFAPEELQEERFNSLCLSRDGRRMAASWGDKLCLWDTTSHEEVRWSDGPKGEVLAAFLRFSADDTEVTGVSPYQRVWRWSAATGKELSQSRPARQVGHLFWKATLSPDGRAVAMLDNSAILVWSWDATSWKELIPIERWPRWGEAAFMTPDVVATWTRGDEEEVIAFWDPTDGKLRRKHTIAVPESGWYRRSLSPDGKLFAACNDKKGVLLFDVASGKELRHFDPPRRNDEQAKFAFSPDGKTLVTTDQPKGLQLWDVETGKPLHSVEGVSDGVMAFSPDGRTVASSFVSRFILTEVASGKARHRLPLLDSPERERSESVFDRIRFSRDGKFVAAFSRCDIYVFSTGRGDTVLHLDLGPRGNSADETGDLSPDGRWLVHAVSYDHGISVRDLNNPRAASEFQTLLGHAGSINAIAFSPDGKYLVSCASDGTALVWDAKLLTGKPNPQKPKAPPAPEIAGLHPPEEESEWAALADADAGKAAKAMAALAESPGTAVPLLKARLKPVESPPAGKVERLIAGLGDDEFDARQQAHKELERLSELAGPALQKTLEGKPSAEAAKRIRQLLSKLEEPVSDPEQLRRIRAVELLERIGTPEAIDFLKALAKGEPVARLTREAKKSLEYLSQTNERK
jgi:WD40 repeat protein